MQQIKIFATLESDVHILERQVNDWLQKNPKVKVIQITGNIAPQTETGLKGGGLSGAGGASDVFLVLLYEIGA